MTELFGRRATIIVGSLTFECGVDEGGVYGLDIEFEVTKTTKSTPNKCELKIFNLTPDHRAELNQPRRVSNPRSLIIQAGYKEDDFLIFAGDIIECETSREGDDYVTIFTAGDGHRARRTARVNQPVAGGTSPQELIRQAALSVGTGLGFTEGQVTGLVNRVIPASTAFLGGSTQVQTATVLSGNAMSELERVCRSTGYEVSIQDGALQFVRTGETTNRNAILLSSNTGVIEAPIRKRSGIVQARTLIIPDLLPGRLVQFDGYEVQGLYRVETAKYIGQTDGADWDIDLECKEV